MSKDSKETKTKTKSKDKIAKPNAEQYFKDNRLLKLIKIVEGKANNNFDSTANTYKIQCRWCGTEYKTEAHRKATRQCTNKTCRAEWDKDRKVVIVNGDEFENIPEEILDKREPEELNENIPTSNKKSGPNFNDFINQQATKHDLKVEKREHIPRSKLNIQTNPDDGDIDLDETDSDSDSDSEYNPEDDSDSESESRYNDVYEENPINTEDTWLYLPGKIPNPDYKPRYRPTTILPIDEINAKRKARWENMKDNTTTTTTSTTNDNNNIPIPRQIPVDKQSKSKRKIPKVIDTWVQTEPEIKELPGNVDNVSLLKLLMDNKVDFSKTEMIVLKSGDVKYFNGKLYVVE